jgi:hypothetical protein
MRIINFFDGAQSETTPTIGNIVASSLVPYADDATYEANEQGAPAEGNVYFNTTDKTIRYYNGTTWQELIDENTVQAVENKAIDADNNMITNIDNNEIKALAGIEATKIADGSVTDAEFQYIGGLTSDAQTQINSKQSTSEKDQPNGYAGLDGSGKILASVVPDSFLQYKGVWNASTNTPTLIDGTGTQGDVYRVSVAGTQDLGSGSQVFAQGDWVTYSGTIWERSDFTGATSISDLTDVDTTGVTDGQFLQYNNGAGEWQPDDISIDELSDVDTTTTPPTIGQALVWDGSTDWVPGSVATGSGAGGINYIENPDAESEGTTGWATYDDGAVAIPVDGTGGSPTQSGFLRSTILPLRGVGSFQLSNQGGDAQGEGVSYDFDIDRADEGKPLSITFNYNADTTNYNSGDVGISIYDVDNALLIPAVNDQDGDIPYNSSKSTQFTASFNASPAGQSYRLVFHIKTTNTSNWNLFFDNVSVGPSKEIQAPIITEWQNFTPVWSGLGGWTFTEVFARYRRVGENLEMLVQANVDGAGAGATTIGLDFAVSGVTTTAIEIPQGYAMIFNSAADSAFTLVGTSLIDSDTFSFLRPNSGGLLVPNNLAASSIIYCNLSVKINEWSSGAVVSTNELGYQTISAKGDLSTGTHTASGAYQTVVYDTEIFDSHNSYNTSTGEFTAPKSGKYEVDGVISFASSASGTRYIQVFVNAVGDSVLGGQNTSATGQAVVSGSTTLDLAKGDVVTVRAYQNSGGNLNYVAAPSSSFSIRSVEDFTTYGVYKNQEYLEAEVTSNVKTVSADTYVDSGASIDLTPGVWNIGYDATLVLFSISGAAGRVGNAAIRDGSNNVIARTAKLTTMTMGTGSGVTDFGSTVSARTRIVVTANTTYKLSCRCNVANTLATAEISRDNYTGGLTDPDTTSVIWAERIS